MVQLILSSQPRSQSLLIFQYPAVAIINFTHHNIVLSTVLNVPLKNLMKAKNFLAHTFVKSHK